MKEYCNYFTEKPFSCNVDGCTMRFASVDHLTIHKKRHDMILTLGLGIKSSGFADQTPTPTQFIKNCEEVGLFQDLQNVNPFEETFKKAVEAVKSGQPISLENAKETNTTDDTLHTPNVFPHIIDGPSIHHKDECLKTADPPGQDVFIKQEKLEIMNSCDTEIAGLGLQETEQAEQTASKMPLNISKTDTPSTNQNSEVLKGPCQVVRFVAPEIPQTQCNMVIVKNADNLYSPVPLCVKDKLKSSVHNKKNAKMLQKVPISKCPSKKGTNILGNKFSNFSKNAMKMISKLENSESESCKLNQAPTKKKKSTRFQSLESRNEYLARSRAASFRCREKKKMYILYLEKVNIELSTANQNLQVLNFSLRKQIQQLHAELMKHRMCNIADKYTESALYMAASVIGEKTQEERPVLQQIPAVKKEKRRKKSERKDDPTTVCTAPNTERSEIRYEEINCDAHYLQFDVAEVTLDEEKDETEIPLTDCSRSTDIIVRFNSVRNDIPIELLPANPFIGSCLEGAGANVKRIYDEHCYFFKRTLVDMEKQSITDIMKADSTLPLEAMELKKKGPLRSINEKSQLDQRTPPPLILLKPFKKRTLQKKKPEKT